MVERFIISLQQRVDYGRVYCKGYVCIIIVSCRLMHYIPRLYNYYILSTCIVVYLLSVFLNFLFPRFSTFSLLSVYWYFLTMPQSPPPTQWFYPTIIVYTISKVSFSDTLYNLLTFCILSSDIFGWLYDFAGTFFI